MLDCEDRAVRARGFKVLCCHPSLPSHHPSRSSYSAPDKVQWLTGKQGREVAACPQGGFHGTWLLSGRPLPGTESICSTNHRHTVTSFFPVLIFSLFVAVLFHSSFLFQTEREAVMEVGQAKTKGGGSRWQFQFDANDLCTIQGQRMICEACAPTHTSIHNLVLDYISI